MRAGIKIKQMQQRDLNDSSQALRQAEQLQVRYTTVFKEQVQNTPQTEQQIPQSVKIKQ